MAQINMPVDIADVLQTVLNDAHVNACAEPLPHDLVGNLPITLVQPISGSRSDIVLDRRAVRLYTWAETYAEADAHARNAMARILLAEGSMVGGVPLYHVVPATMPYTAYDPDHPTIPRVAQTMDVYIRALTTETTT